MKYENSDIYEDVIDILIRESGSRAADRLFDEIDASIADEDIVFSPEHTEKIKRILGKEKNKYSVRIRKRSIRRLFIAAVAIIILIVFSVLTVSAFKEVIVNYIFKNSPYDTEYRFDTDEEMSGDVSLNIFYVPENFENIYGNTVDVACFKRYEYKDLCFDVKKQPVPDTFSFDTEGRETSKFTIDGSDAFLSVSKDNSILTLIKNGYLYTITGDIDKDNLIIIAENIS